MKQVIPGDRVRLAIVVWGVLISQVLLYPGLEDLTEALGGGSHIQAGMWFLVAEFTAFITCAGIWGVVSDTTGKRLQWVVLGALGGGASYIILPVVASSPAGFYGVLVVRFIGGTLSIGAFSLGITMLMDLSGGNGRNMGAAGIAIGLGAAIGSVVGGQLTELNAFAPLYAGALVLGLVAVLAATVTDRSPSDRNDARNILTRVRERPELGVAYTFGFADRLTAGFFSLAGIYYFRDSFGVDAATAGITLALFFFPFALLQYPFGALSDRTGRFIPVVCGSALYGITIIAVGLAPVYAVAAGLMVFVGVSGAFMAPATMALVSDLVDPDERGTAMGGFNIFGSLGFLAGFVIAGTLVSQTSYLTAFLVVGGIEIGIAAIGMIFLRRVFSNSSRLSVQKNTSGR